MIHKQQLEKSKPDRIKIFDYSKVPRDKLEVGLLEAINDRPSMRLLTSESVKILIDLRWNKYAKQFFGA